MKDPLTMERTLEPTGDPAWVLYADGYDALRETCIESRFAISNGFLGVRGARSITRGARWIVPARTYVAGMFDTASAGAGPPGLVPAADWLQLRIMLPGGPLVHHPGDVISHRMTLDMKRGGLLSESRRLRTPDPNDPDVAFRVRTLRLVSLGQRAIGLQVVQCEVEEGDVAVTLEASFEGIDLELITERLEQDLGVWRTHTSGKRLAIATGSTLRIDGRELSPTSNGNLTTSWTWTCRRGQMVQFERTVAVVRADTEDQGPVEEAREKLGVARQLGWRGVVAEHEAAWKARWRCSDVGVEGDAVAQRDLRFAVYHLNSAANPADERVSIGARALTGDDYRGHVFWDTEVYLLPFYCLTWPGAARSLLMYRFRTLDGARSKAAGMGWRGALYAWESADTGKETTPEHAIGPDRRVIDILCGKQEQHISADVAYAVWQYWIVSGDDAFLLEAGAEIILETARFWSSRARLESDGRSHIRGVIGPDEYHEHIDDNAFTNVMARWNIRRALDIVSLLRKRWPARWRSLSAHLKLDDGELVQWAHTIETLATGFNPKTGMFEQFAGYFDLEDIDLLDYAGRCVPMDLILGRDRIGRSQVVKQADVVALLGLLPDEFPGTAAAENFRYYEPRCSHGSSLSRAMHALVAAKLGLSEMALRYFGQTAEIDLGDTHVGIDGGIHIAALGGIWMTAVFGFGGLSIRADGVALDPRLPPTWSSLSFSFQWQRRAIRIRIGQKEGSIDATIDEGAAMMLHIAGRPYALDPGKTLHVSLGKSDAQPVSSQRSSPEPVV